MKKLFQLLPLLVTLFVSQNLIAQQIDVDSVVSNLETQVANFPLEKVYIHTDRPYYTAGDDIWYAAYVVNGNDHSEDPVSGLVYVELINAEGKVINKKQADLDGKFGSGVLETDEDLEPGKYQIRGYTAYMLNYTYEYAFTKEIGIYNSGDSEVKSKATVPKPTSLRFFPEGGELVVGIDCKVAFEVSDTTVKSIEVIDLLGNLVAIGKVIHNGIGFFNITPSMAGGYSVKYKRKNFPLPQALTDGYGFKVNNLRANDIYVDVSCSDKYDLSGSYVIGHIRGLVFLEQAGMQGKQSTIKINKSNLPEGVAQFTLFNARCEAVAERAVFLSNSSDNIDVSTSIPYEYLNTRQKADLTVSLKDDVDLSVDGDLSVSIVDAGLVFSQDKGVNIQNYLLLGSEFTREVPDLGSYFVDDSKKTQYHLDLLMMTRAWSRIRWIDVNKNIFPQLTVPAETGFMVSGIVLHRGDPVRAKVDVSVVKGVFSGGVIDTKDDGTFFVNLQGIQDSSQVYLKASLVDPTNPKRTGSVEGVTLSLFADSRFDRDSKNVMSFEMLDENMMDKYIEQSKKILTLDSIYGAEWQIELETVSIKAKNTNRDKVLKKDFSIPYVNYSNRVMFDSIGTGQWGRSVFEIVRDFVPGVKIFGTAGLDQKFELRGGSGAMIESQDNFAKVLVDGMEVSEATVNSIRADRIAFVDVLKGAASSTIYGGMNGVVAIYLKQGSDQELINDYSMPDHIKSINYEGYKSNREFYSPDYSKAFAGAEKPDLRTTLYWNPRIITEDGIGKASFFTSDKLSRYIIEVQGLTKGGVPFVGYDVMEVR